MVVDPAGLAGTAAGGDETAAVVNRGLACAVAAGDDETAVFVAAGLACAVAAGGDETAVFVAAVIAPGLTSAAPAIDETAVKPTTVWSSKAWLTLVPRMLQPHISTHLISARQKCERQPYLWMLAHVGQRIDRSGLPNAHVQPGSPAAVKLSGASIAETPEALAASSGRLSPLPHCAGQLALVLARQRLSNAGSLVTELRILRRHCCLLAIPHARLWVAQEWREAAARKARQALCKRPVKMSYAASRFRQDLFQE